MRCTGEPHTGHGFLKRPCTACQSRKAVTPSGKQLVYGHIRMNCDIVISGGLGCSIAPFRFGVAPEIVVVTINGTAESV